MEKIREGKVEEAVAILLETNPLASITGRICSAYCEEDCNRHDFDEPVGFAMLNEPSAIYPWKTLKNTIRLLRSESGKSVAIVGSGPAGLIRGILPAQTRSLGDRL